jgi:hypothetical protein
MTVTHQNRHRRATTSLVLACLSLALATLAAQSGLSRRWSAPGQGAPLAEFSTYDNERGHLGVFNASGNWTRRDIRSSSRSAPTAARASPAISPRTAMSISVRSIRERWAATGGKDPLFAAVDG